MRACELFENENPILQLIEKAKDHVGLPRLMGGNCGTFVLALYYELKEKGINSTFVFILDQNNHDIQPGDMESLIGNEPDVYHVMLEHDGSFYDGHGVPGLAATADWIEAQYRDYNAVLWHEIEWSQGVEILIDNDTNWDISTGLFRGMMQ